MTILRSVAAAAASVLAFAAAADTIPTADTDDAGLNTVEVRTPRRAHLVAKVELGNGDYSRGGYDDDASNLNRLPLHLGLSASVQLRSDLFLIGTASNGFHAPASAETGRPPAWYESNAIGGVAWRPRDGLTAAVLYTVKSSPNDVSRTQHEASLSLASDRGLKPTAVVTARAKGGHGGYAQLGIAPDWTLAGGDDAPKVDLPLKLGVGWSGFYGSGTGTVPWGSAGVGVSGTVRAGAQRLHLRAEAVALVRSGTLRRLDGENGNRNTVVPLVALSLSYVY